MAKLTNEYIQGRVALERSVKDAYLDEDGNAVIIAADGYGWDCGDMPPATVDTIPASKGAKYFNLSLDRIKPIAVVEAAQVEDTAEDEFDDADGDYDAPEETEEDAEDDNA